MSHNNDMSQQDHNGIQDTTRPQDHSHSLANENQEMIKSSNPPTRSALEYDRDDPELTPRAGLTPSNYSKIDIRPRSDLASARGAANL